MEDLIGKYEIRAELGRGGFGRVYRAYDPSMGRAVAIKVLTSEGDPDLLARFRAEAALTGKLQHKNIVTVYDSGEQNGSPYIVMELLEGENLQEILETKKQLPVLSKLRIMCQVAEGLQYAHACGVVHRDVKPANIMLLPTGLVKVMDFGIARLVGMANSRRTRRGDLLGTTSYMSPEQFRGSDADAQTDVFAFGVIFYELLSGVHPFHADDVSAAIYRIMSVDPLPLHDVAPDCPEPLEALVSRALAKDRARRYSSLEDILFDVEPILLDLRRDQAANLMVEVSGLMTRGDFDAAHAKLKLALELDPSNRDARRVRETIQEEKNRRVIEETIAALQREAAAKMVSRQFGDAIQKLDAALRLRPEDALLKESLQNAQIRLLANREASRLLSEAKREAQQERIEEARLLAVRAMETDSEHPDAPPLVKHLDEVLERVERARRLRSELDAVEKLLAQSRFDEAREKIEPLGALYPGAQQIKELQERIQARQTEELRRQRAEKLESGLTRVRDLRREERSLDALSAVDGLQREFHGVTAVENLKSLIEEEITSAQTSQELEGLLSEARQQMWAGHLDESLKMLQQCRMRFVSDASLERLFEACRALIAEAQRRDAVEKIVARARMLKKNGQVDEAHDLLKNTIRVHGQDASLSGLSKVITLELEDRRSTERLAQYRRDASQLLAAASYADALTILREARTQFPMEPSVELQLAAAEDGCARHNESELVATVLALCAEKEKAGDLAGALEEAAKGLRKLPAAKDLLQAAASLREKIQNVERSKRVAEVVRATQGAIDGGDWARAKATVSHGQHEFPDQIIFDELLAQLTRKERSAEAEKALSGAREHLDRGNLEGAAVALADLEATYGSDDLWKAEKKRLEVRQAFLADLRKAEGLRNRGQYEESGLLLERLVRENPTSTPAAALLKTVQAEVLRDPQSALRFPPNQDGNDASVGDLTAVVRASKLPVRPSVIDALREIRGKSKGGEETSDAAKNKPRVRFDDAFADAARVRVQKRNCANCGTVLPDRARFCDNCGKAVEVENGTGKPSQ